MNLAKRFLVQHVVNGKLLAEACTTMELFSQANGEYDRSGTLRRVGFLPFPICNYKEYLDYVARFEVVPVLTPLERSLNPLGAVYFWVRVRGEPGNLRVEYRPMNMSSDWRSSIETFLSLVRSELVPKQFRWE